MKANRQTFGTWNAHGRPPAKIKAPDIRILAFDNIYFRSHFYVRLPCFVKGKKQSAPWGSRR
jgi:hypothetical protein